VTAPILPRLVRYFDLSGAVDADPLIAQPGPGALGPLTSGFGGAILINGWEVDVEGRRVAPTPGLELTVGVVTLSGVEPETRPPGATATEALRETFWGRGPLSEGVEPGEWQIQAELGDGVRFTVAVTAKAASPAGRWLAIYAARGPRGVR
jgi:hypothetical protein